MKILIIGAGAIGCLVGGKLAHSGHAVTFGSRPRFVETLRTQGLVLMDETGRHVIGSAEATPSIADALRTSERPFDLAILTVKSYDTATAVQELHNVATETGLPLPPILSLQNGVGNEQTIVEGLAALGVPVLAGVITTPVSVPGPGIIQIDRPSYTLGLSLWTQQQGGASSDSIAASPAVSAPAGLPILTQTQEALRTAGFRVRHYADAQGLKWTKLLMNMMGNALSAILDEPPARLFLDARLADLEIQAWRETLQVMSRAGILPVNLVSYPFAWLAPVIRYAPKTWLRPVLAAQVGKARGSKMPSLHIDLHKHFAAATDPNVQQDMTQTTAQSTAQAKGQAAVATPAVIRSEIDWLNGAVVQKGRAVGVSTPVNTLLTETLRHLCQNPAAMVDYRHNPERLLSELDG